MSAGFRRAASGPEAAPMLNRQSAARIPRSWHRGASAARIHVEIFASVYSGRLVEVGASVLVSGVDDARTPVQSAPRESRLTTEVAHARDDICRPFPQADQLATARDRAARLEEKPRETAVPSQRGNDHCIVAAGMTGIPGATVSASGHRNGQPQSAAQVSRRDVLVDNPLAGTAQATGQVASTPRTQVPRDVRHVG
jgi:hypothetical protein